MTAKELVKKYAMTEHIENGCFIECHYPAAGPERAASGSIYYYVGPQEITEFHKIDCDEYWCYVAGSNLEIWQIDEGGSLKIDLLGAENEANPLVYLRKGTKFASRHADKEADGTFLICITVPRFSYQGFELLSKEEMLAAYPEVEKFYANQEK